MTRPVFLESNPVVEGLRRIRESAQLPREPSRARPSPRPARYESFSWAGADYQIEQEAAMPSSPDVLDQLAAWILSDGTAKAGPRLPQHFGAAGDPAAGPADGGELQERLAARVEAMKNMTQLQVLGLGKGAAAAEVHRAYLELATEAGRDLHSASGSAEVKRLAEEVLAMLQTAADVLGDREEGAHHQDEFELEPDGGVAPDRAGSAGTPRSLAADGSFLRGKELLDEALFQEAAAAFRDAVSRDGAESELHAYLGWSLFQTDSEVEGVIRRSILHLDEALRLDPDSAKGHLFLGQIFNRTGRPDEAVQQFEAAIRCSPGCPEAVQELGVLERASARHEAERGLRSARQGRPLP